MPQRVTFDIQRSKEIESRLDELEERQHASFHSLFISVCIGEEKDKVIYFGKRLSHEALDFLYVPARDMLQ